MGYTRAKAAGYSVGIAAIVAVGYLATSAQYLQSSTIPTLAVTGSLTSDTLTVATALTCQGTSTIGNDNADSTFINGSVTHADDGNAYNLTATPSGATAQRIAMQTTMQGTYDTTGGGITAIGYFAAISSARSAGASNLTNVAILGNASGGQVNRALQTNAGDVVLNAVSGTFTATAGGTTTANWTTTGSGDLVSGDALTVANNATLGDANADKATLWGHVQVEGTAPTLSSCGSGPSITGTDSAGYFTTGTVGITCTITFSRTYTVEPSCVLYTQGSATMPTCTTSATAITCSTTAGSTKYHYQCIGVPGGT